MKQTLIDYLQHNRDAVVWKLAGLGEYDLRRPLTPTGTNLLGIVKHLASVELGYFGETFGRPSGIPLPWFAPDAEPNADMFATADESREQIIGLYHRAWEHAAQTFAELELTDLGRVPWWPPERAEVSLHRILVHMITETARHAGHADIVRELLDGSVGYRPDNDNLADLDAAGWVAQHERLTRLAEQFRG